MYASATSAQTTLTVTKVSSQVTLAGEGTTAYGTAVTFTATVTEGATGSVSFEGLPGGAVSAPVVDGVATLTVPATLAAGAYTLRATYGGDDRHEASASAVTALTVTKLTGKVAISAAGSARYGSAVKVTVAVTDSRGKPAAGKVTLSGAGSSVTATVPSSGKAVITLPKSLAVKSYTLKATYAGSTNVAGASATARLTVTRGSVAKVGARVTVVPTTKTTGKAAVTVTTASGLATATGKVTVTVQKGSVKKSVTATLRYGKATVSLPKLTKGTWRVSVSYAGSTTYAPATATTTVVVKK